MLHAKRECREMFCLPGKKVQEVPLRHERDEFAMRRQTRKIGHRNKVTVENAADLSQLLVRQLEKLLKQSEFMHDLERRRMNGVAAEIAVEIGVLFQNG